MKEIAAVLNQSKKIAIFVHISADGDALGSAFALKYSLENIGKVADVYLNEKISERLAFLADFSSAEYKIGGLAMDYDAFAALDCGDEFRLGMYKDDYLRHPLTVNIDHHFTNKEYAKYNYVDGTSAATGELIAALLDEMGVELDSVSASLLYAAISSDTGCFAYSNATEKTYILAAKLLKKGINNADINRLLFSTTTLLELKLQSFLIENLELHHNGKLSVATITEEQLFDLGAAYEHTEGLIDTLRSVKGVEVACLIKQKNGVTKGSIRTNAFVDAAAISAYFGGGGHIRAAGFSSEFSVDETKNKIIDITKDLF